MKRGNLIKVFLLLGILVVTLQGVSAFCAERTTYGATCQDVPMSEVNTAYQYSPNACSGTEFCAQGTCVDTKEGTCDLSSRVECLPEEGGVYYSDIPANIPSCRIGCCLYGEQASFTTSARCDVLAGNAGYSPNFDASISDQDTCTAMAFPQAKGACVYETNSGRTCGFTTRELCTKNHEGGLFYQDFLCTNPSLATNCVRTTDTTCLDTADQVFFRDSCGQPANVYDASKADDTLYWSFVSGTNGVTLDLDVTQSAGSATNGNCNYNLGRSICSSYDVGLDGIKAGLMGNNICRSVNCNSGTFAELFNAQYQRKPYNGETWCGKSNKGGVSLGGNLGVNATEFASYNKKGNNPGDTDVLFTCMNGRITTEVNAQYRNKVCIQNITTEGYVGATWETNDWQFCTSLNSSADCLNTEFGDCQWITGAGVLKDGNETNFVYDEPSDSLVPREDGTNAAGGEKLDNRTEAGCFPRYPPGFDASVTATTTPSNICAQANRICYVSYSRGLIGDWHVSQNINHLAFPFGAIAKLFGQGEIVCLDNDETLVPEWATNIENACMAIGDCGISVNYAGGEGANVRDDLFTIIEGNSSGILK